MNLSRFFITRPIFAGVLSLLIFILGAISLFQLPITEYPEVAPPTVIVTANYPGANPKTIAETVASPLEQTINGIENMLYMASQSTSNGVMTLTVTFKLGTNIDMAQVQVQNRVSQVLPKLPEEVRRFGVSTVKSSPDMTLVVHLLSPKNRYDEVYLRNYATLNVKDELARLPGVGQVNIFGGGDYAMRIWIDPDKAASRGLTSGDIVNAIREQNIQVAAGTIGQQPMKGTAPFELTVNARGRLVTEEEFDNIIVKTGPNGEKMRLKDVARTELGAGDYSMRSLLNNQKAVGMGVFQLPGSNALAISENVRTLMDNLKKRFPEDLDYAIAYDPTIFVRKSIDAVIHTLIEAVLLVVLVVVIFLQTWRASIIPLVAVPVSLVGTFAVMHALGFSINNLSLFGLVLAIGIVVDDAIVVVENVERNIHEGLNPLEATKKAMTEVTGPIIATALVLCAVFIPTAFISGLSGQFYKQFAVTIAISTVISAINSLTLSPALSALLLRDHSSKKDILTRVMDALLGWFFRPFNRFFEWSSNVYVGIVKRIIRFSIIALVFYGGFVWLTVKVFDKVPTGFVPAQDKQYLIGFAQLPDASSLDRTEDVMRRMTDIVLDQPGVKDAITFPGLSIHGFSASPDSGIVFVALDDFENRITPELSAESISNALNGKFMQIQDAMVLVLSPPPVNGIGTTGGFKMMIQDRGDQGYDALYKATQGLIGSAYATGGKLQQVYSGYSVNVPQLEAEVDREKAKVQGVPLANLFETLQVNLGSLYVNDMNRFGRTYQVMAQAEAKFRDDSGDITRLKTRNSAGQMVPIGSLVTVKEGNGPSRVSHYNGYLAADLNGSAGINPETKSALSSGQGEDVITQLAKDLPPGFEFQWTDLVYQKIIAGNSAVYIYPLCILLVFMVLAAQYESTRLPLAIILIVPVCLLFALAGVALLGGNHSMLEQIMAEGFHSGLKINGDNNIFTQIGFIVLIGLACKNAILIVEFAKEKNDHGLSPLEAALEACRLRLRPILMTSIAFIAGVYPLVVSTGAGAEMRRAMGTAVFAGMIGVTFLGLFLTPVFYVLVMKIGRKKKTSETPLPASAAQAGAEH